MECQWVCCSLVLALLGRFAYVAGDGSAGTPKLPSPRVSATRLVNLSDGAASAPPPSPTAAMPSRQSFFVVTTGDYIDIWTARAICQSNGGDLASIRSIQESKLVQQLVLSELPFSTTKGWNQAWIGLVKQEDSFDNPLPIGANPWAWLDGWQGTATNPMAMLWRAGQPNNAGGNQRCVVATYVSSSNTSNWNDHDCATLNNAVVCGPRSTAIYAPKPNMPEEAPPAATYSDGDLRVVQGGIAGSGMVQMYLNGTWGMVLSKSGYYGSNIIAIACRQLGGYSNGQAVVIGYPFPTTPALFTLDRCNGNETRLLDCPHLMQQPGTVYSNATSKAYFSVACSNSSPSSP